MSKLPRDETTCKQFIARGNSVDYAEKKALGELLAIVELMRKTFNKLNSLSLAKELVLREGDFGLCLYTHCAPGCYADVIFSPSSKEVQVDVFVAETREKIASNTFLPQVTEAEILHFIDKVFWTNT